MWQISANGSFIVMIINKQALSASLYLNETK